ncbi:MAG: ABC transporter permease [Bacteroidota bacterium]
MLRLISIEFFKLRNTKFFWVLSGLFIVVLIAIPISVKLFLDYLTSIGDNPFRIGIAPNQLPLFDFVDIWQNLTWTYSFLSIFLGFIAVISVCNEFTYGTIKQNVIDGMSRRELFLSKIGFVTVLSIVMSLAVGLVGLITGFFLSPVKSLPFILQNIEFLPAYTLHLIAFQLFCMIAALIIKRPGITLAGLMFYIYFLEPILVAFMKYEWNIPFWADLLPIKAIGNVIPLPFPKYVLMETETFVPLDHLGIHLLYLLIFWFVADRLMVKRDLN